MCRDSAGSPVSARQAKVEAIKERIYNDGGAVISMRATNCLYNSGAYWNSSTYASYTPPSLGGTIDHSVNYSNLYTLTDFYYGFESQLQNSSGAYLSSGYMANVYPKNNQENESLEGVDIMTAQYGTSYESYINPNSSSLLSCNFSLVKSGTLNLPGYYTLEMETPILLSNDCESFAIVVKLTAPSDISYLYFKCSICSSKGCI